MTEVDITLSPTYSFHFSGSSYGVPQSLLRYEYISQTGDLFVDKLFTMIIFFIFLRRTMFWSFLGHDFKVVLFVLPLTLFPFSSLFTHQYNQNEQTLQIFITLKFEGSPTTPNKESESLLSFKSSRDTPSIETGLGKSNGSCDQVVPLTYIQSNCTQVSIRRLKQSSSLLYFVYPVQSV